MKSLLLRIFPMLIVGSMILVSCSIPGSALNPDIISTPTVILAPSPTSPAPQNDDVWDRIVANKKIVVGTSWDYPPFGFVDPEFKVVGFDVALIEEIGRRLQIPIEIQNYAFEGLTGALQINQIDLAIAAISITPERVNQMSFSPIYYVNQTAVLARNDALITSITDFNQLAGYRVGVQRGTAYESMVQSLLVDSGLMSADKLLSYIHTDDSVRDLLANRVDVVVLGQATANYYSSQPGLIMVGTGFQEQNLAVAMRTETPRLKAEIDRVIGEMLTDGTILSFIQQYIQSDITELPFGQSTSIPGVTVPTLVPAACVNGMKFVADVTFADNNMTSPPFVNPGEGFVKVWRVQNTGSCTWTPSYKLVYAYGNVAAAQMSGQPLNIPANVAPGEMIDLSVALIAPVDPLTYQGFWQMESDKSQRFGQTIWVAISTLVGAASPVATVASSTNSCVVTVTSPNGSIVVGNKFDAIWTVKNTSGKEWNSDSSDYKFVSGTKMQEKDFYDFTRTIKDGESGKIIVGMKAPGESGVYNANWAIVTGSTTLCTMSVSVTVTSN